MWDLLKYGDLTALITETGKIINYRNLYLEIEKLAKFLIMGKLVMIKAYLSEETIIGYVSAINHGVTVIIASSERDFTELLKVYRPFYIWQRRDDQNIQSYKRIYEYQNNELLVRNNELEYPIHPELALLLSTSGSTGSKKYVRISKKNLQANTKSIIESLGIVMGDRAALMLPMSYTYGLSIVNTYLYQGGCLLVPNSSMIHPDFWKFIEKNECNAICGVPNTYNFLKKMNFHNRSLNTLKLATQAGGKMNLETEKYMLNVAQDKGFRLAIMYGQTEATARMSCHILNENSDKIGSAGKAIPGGKIEIIEDEIIYQGKNVTLGYAESYLDLCKGDERKGILQTGDLGYLDEDGYIYITGRKNRIAKINGFRINLDELQEKICVSIDIECACIEHMESIVLYFSDSTRRESEVVNYLQKECNINRSFFKIEHINKLPKNTNGKINYLLLRELCEVEHEKGIT